MLKIQKDALKKGYWIGNNVSDNFQIINKKRVIGRVYQEKHFEEMNESLKLEEK